MINLKFECSQVGGGLWQLSQLSACCFRRNHDCISSWSHKDGENFLGNQICNLSYNYACISTWLFLTEFYFFAMWWEWRTKAIKLVLILDLFSVLNHQNSILLLHTDLRFLGLFFWIFQILISVTCWKKKKISEVPWGPFL